VKNKSVVWQYIPHKKEFYRMHFYDKEIPTCYVPCQFYRFSFSLGQRGSIIHDSRTRRALVAKFAVKHSQAEAIYAPFAMNPH